MQNTRKVIVHLRGSDFYGSPERLIIGQVEHLADFDFVCATFLKADSSSQYLNEIEKRGLNGIAVEDNHLFDPHIPGRIRNLLLDNRANLLVSHEYKSNFYGCLATRRMKIPHVAYFHGWTQEGLRVKVYNWLDRRILPRLDRVITVSESTKRLLVKSGVAPDKIDVVYNAVEFDKNNRPIDKAREAVARVGYIGRLSHEKGVHNLLRAISLIKAKDRSFKVEIYGSGPDEKKLKDLSEDLAISDRVAFMGFREDIDSVYKTLDFLILPSLSEGHPVTILEAWKYSVGVIATRAGGIPEVMEDGVDGILVNVADIAGLARAIMKGLDNLALMDDYGSKGLENLRKNFSFEKQAEHLSQIYKNILSSRSD